MAVNGVYDAVSADQPVISADKLLNNADKPLTNVDAVKPLTSAKNLVNDVCSQVF